MCLQHWSWGQLLKGKILLQETEGESRFNSTELEDLTQHSHPNHSLGFPFKQVL